MTHTQQEETTMTTHRHTPATERMRCWDGCVAPRPGHDERAHGWATYVATCRCGATRQTEANGGEARSGRWLAADDDD